MIGFKLFRKRKDGTLGPLFINRRQRIKPHVWLDAEDHPTKGYAHRPGWHICSAPVAPHLSKKDRVWCIVAFEPREVLVRPASQGGTWYLADRMRVVSEFEGWEWPYD